MVEDIKHRHLGIDTISPKRGVRKFKYSLMAKEVPIFCGLVHKEAPQRAVEIGTWWGLGAETIVEMSPGCRVLTIDHKDQKVSRDPDLGPPASGIEYLIADSKTVVLPREWYGAADLVFVDGDHQRNGIVSDTRLALSLVRPGGLVVWHDVMEYGSRSETAKRTKNGYYVSEYFYKEFPLTIQRIQGTALGIHRAAAPS